MPVVPIRPAAPASAQPMPQPDPTFLAMAAAQMHGEGKFEVGNYDKYRKSDNIEDRRTTTEVGETSGFDPENLKEGGERLEEMKPSSGVPSS